jgi:N-methylhydantoinase B
MAYAMINLVQSRSWNQGDMLVLNDPYKGGTHLPDVTLVAPVFAAGDMVGFVANRAHHADIGSDAPGSMPVSASLDEEGILISPTLILKKGELQQDWFNSILAGMNEPETARGDFSAQIAANLTGVQRLDSLILESGLETFYSRCEQLQGYAEKLAASSLRSIPHGHYSFTDYLDDDGFGHALIAIKVTLKIGADGICADFTGSDAQVPGNLNCPMPVTAAAVHYVFRCLLPPQIPACDGSMRFIEILAAKGSVVNAAPPAAVAAGNVETSSRIVDVVMGALAQALPGEIPAASQGTMNNLAMGRLAASVMSDNMDNRTGKALKAWDYYETVGGGAGAGPDCNGMSCRHTHMTNTLNTPIEVIELQYPLRIVSYAQRTASGGRGRWRGGDGVVREYHFTEDADVSVVTERRSRPPWGLSGGAPGLPGRNLLDGQRIPAKCQLAVRQGQVLRIETPGGGGFGSE